MRKALPRPKGVPERIQLLVDLAGGFRGLIGITGLSRTALGGWVRGPKARTPHPTQRHHLAESCGISLHWLRTGEGLPPQRLNPGKGFPDTESQPAEDHLAQEWNDATRDAMRANPVPFRANLPGQETNVVSVGPPTITSLGYDWATTLGLSGGAASVLCTDETAAPLIRLGEPVLLAWVADWRSALPLHPDAVWSVEVSGKFLLRRIVLSGPQAELHPVGNKRAAKIRVHADALVVRGRAVWSGARL